MTRNKINHSQQLEVREIYEQVDSLQKFFECFLEGRNNKISQLKDQFVRLIDNMRLFILEKLIREEQYKQILRSLGSQNGQIFEFRGYNELYASAVGLPVSNFT